MSLRIAVTALRSMPAPRWPSAQSAPRNPRKSGLSDSRRGTSGASRPPASPTSSPRCMGAFTKADRAGISAHGPAAVPPSLSAVSSITPAKPASASGAMRRSGIALTVGEQASDKPLRLGECGQFTDRSELPIQRREQADLDVVDAGRRDLPYRRDNRAGRRIRVTADCTGGSAATDGGERFPDACEGQRSERAGGWVLQVDDVGTAANRDLGLFGTGHACEHRGGCTAAGSFRVSRHL